MFGAFQYYFFSCETSLLDKPMAFLRAQSVCKPIKTMVIGAKGFIKGYVAVMYGINDCRYEWERQGPLFINMDYF